MAHSMNDKNSTATRGAQATHAPEENKQWDESAMARASVCPVPSTSQSPGSGIGGGAQGANEVLKPKVMMPITARR